MQDIIINIINTKINTFQKKFFEFAYKNIYNMKRTVYSDVQIKCIKDQSGIVLYWIGARAMSVTATMPGTETLAHTCIQ